MSIRVPLTDEDFKALVNGQVVKRDGVEVALNDIGFARMLQLVYDAKENKQQADYAKLDREL